MILYHDDGYFTVEHRAIPRDGTFDDADRWVAQIERALLDTDLPVMLGNVYHEDNVPVTDDQFYDE